MNGLYTIILLILSNVFMTLAWYGHLKLQETGISAKWPLLGVIAFSWGIAFFEYCCQVPANRMGFEGNGGPLSPYFFQCIVYQYGYRKVCNKINDMEQEYIVPFVDFCLIIIVHYLFASTIMLIIKVYEYQY